MATHSTICAWRIPGTEKPGGLHYIGSKRIGYDWSKLAYMYLFKTVFSPQMKKNSDTRKWVSNFRSVQFSRSVVSDFLQPHESQHTRHLCPSPTPGVHSDSRPSSQWCHPAISSSVLPFSFCPQSLPASGSFPMSQLFTWGGQSIGVSASASVLPMMC